MVKKVRGKLTRKMKHIHKKFDRLVAFSKMRREIGKEAAELALTCGAEVGFVAFSPSGKPCSFGTPSVEHVLNRFQGLPLNESNDQTNEDIIQEEIEQKIKEYNKAVELYEAEKDREKALRQKMKDMNIKEKGWWETPLDNLNKEELKDILNRFSQLRIAATAALKEMGGATSSTVENLEIGTLTLSHLSGGAANGDAEKEEKEKEVAQLGPTNPDNGVGES